MVAFASDRRSGWVRVLVLILCALFIFATIATPPAYAVGETVALFGLAAVLSAATAALGFKLANNAEGQATLEKMVQDFTGASIAAGLVLTGTKVNGLINGMKYIKMAVHNGKTYLDERVAAWCQQWLADHGVYDSGGVDYSGFDNILSSGGSFSASQVFSLSFDQVLALAAASGKFSSAQISSIQKTFDDHISSHSSDYVGFTVAYSTKRLVSYVVCYKASQTFQVSSSGSFAVLNNPINTDYADSYFGGSFYPGQVSFFNDLYSGFYELPYDGIIAFSGVGSLSDNNTGLSGTDTLGEDYINKTLDQILQGLKEWAQDWYDAGADSMTNAATGAKDLPLSVATGAATLNPDIAEDGPLIYFPTFDWPLGKLRSGETDSKTVDQGKENASSAETSVDVAENQTVIDSLVNWALGYISPDTGLFSKFPLCVPYDAYLLACASLGVDVVQSDSIFGASPDDLSSIVQTGTDEQSEGFTPVFTISNDLTLDGYTYPLKLTIDLTDWTPLIKFVRLAISITVIAELIGAEYKRIKGK